MPETVGYFDPNAAATHCAGPGGWRTFGERWRSQKVQAAVVELCNLPYSPITVASTVASSAALAAATGLRYWLHLLVATTGSMYRV
jgi:hypothetical protein